MAGTGYILPADVDLEALIGANFSTTISLYSDAAQTSPFDLTGYTVTMPIGSLFTLTAGSGLTVTAAGGTIVAALTAAQTATVQAQDPPYTAHWQLKLTDGGGTVSYPLSGDIKFVIP